MTVGTDGLGEGGGVVQGWIQSGGRENDGRDGELP